MSTIPQRIVVTGGSGGIGRVIAHAFTGADAMVVNLDLQPGAEAQALCGPNLRTIVTDLADADSIEVAFAEADRLFAAAAPQVLVCCAAVSAAEHFLDVPIAELDRLLAVNVRGTFLACQAGSAAHAGCRRRPDRRDHLGCGRAGLGR